MGGPQTPPPCSAARCGAAEPGGRGAVLARPQACLSRRGGGGARGFEPSPLTLSCAAAFDFTASLAQPLGLCPCAPAPFSSFHPEVIQRLHCLRPPAGLASRLWRLRVQLCSAWKESVSQRPLSVGESGSWRLKPGPKLAEVRGSGNWLAGVWTVL